MIWHQKNRSAIKYIQQRDFLEKKVKFTDGNKRYVYFTSLPDEILPIEEGVSRGYTLIGFHCFERQEDGRILMEGIMQNDFNIGTGAMAKIAQAAIMSALPKSLKAWFTSLEEHTQEMTFGPKNLTPE